MLDRCISTHAPPAGSDSAVFPMRQRSHYFNPRSPCGERPAVRGATRTITGFQPTLPLRGATEIQIIPYGNSIFQPTLPLRGATRLCFLSRRKIHISTHAPPAGSDPFIVIWPSRTSYFNPRSPCGERPGLFNNIVGTVLFQPTLPLRGEIGRAHV